ncbi:UNVERIFIED_CONTAM: hypothetical protein RMT77_010661 [Armadillidium vulgare]|nr:Small integral membrane protein 8 [Armadillidium vulgare]RXG72040.1 Small integral membrane protein 8 [Armadillidium vulgare]
MDKQKPAPGEGIKSIRTTNVFKIINFELYAKPNLIIMTFGVVGILFSGAYLAYMRAQIEKNNTYVAIGENGNQTLMQKRSKWD